jgi:hypothetical protein
MSPIQRGKQERKPYTYSENRRYGAVPGHEHSAQEPRQDVEYERRHTLRNKRAIRIEPLVGVSGQRVSSLGAVRERQELESFPVQSERPRSLPLREATLGHVESQRTIGTSNDGSRSLDRLEVSVTPFDDDSPTRLYNSRISTIALVNAGRESSDNAHREDDKAYNSLPLVRPQRDPSVVSHALEPVEDCQQKVDGHDHRNIPARARVMIDCQHQFVEPAAHRSLFAPFAFRACHLVESEQATACHDDRGPISRAIQC